MSFPSAKQQQNLPRQTLFRYNKGRLPVTSRKKGGISIKKWWVLYVVLTIALVLTAGCLGSKTPPVSSPPAPAVLVDYYRTGGIAGFDDRLVIFDNGVGVVSSKTVNQEIEINHTDIDRIVTLFNQSQFSILEANYSARPGSADLIKYTVSYHSKTVTAEDTVVPPSLQPVINELNRILNLASSMKQTSGMVSYIPG
jgi:hypothetical protein